MVSYEKFNVIAFNIKEMTTEDIFTIRRFQMNLDDESSGQRQ